MDDQPNESRWKQETEEEVLVRLERLYDAMFNVYCDIHTQLIRSGWRKLPARIKQTESLTSPDGKYTFHFVLYPEDGKPFFEVDTK